MASLNPFEKVRVLHQKDLKKGYDGVFLPASFEKKARSAARDLVWQWAFPAQRLTLAAALTSRSSIGMLALRIEAGSRGEALDGLLSTRRPTASSHLCGGQRSCA
jgi:hypothetical protein